MISKSFLALCAAAAFSLSNVEAASSSYTVGALANSSTGGTPVSTVSLNFGDFFSVFVDPNDLWNAGSLPRWSNADGLIVDRFATGSDESGQAAGVQIGADFPDWTQHGLTAPFGALVGKIGTTYFEIGTSFSGPAPATGVLELMYWDQNNGDNTESIKATITTPSGVPDVGSSAALLALGIAGLAAARKRMKRA